MSYRNPQQYVPQQYAQQNQKLQDTIAGTAARLSASYVQEQKVKKAENKQLEKENKATQANIDGNIADIRTNLYLFDKKNGQKTSEHQLVAGAKQSPRRSGRFPGRGSARSASPSERKLFRSHFPESV